MDITMEHMDAAKDGIRKLIERRDRYRQELARCKNQQTYADKFMTKVYQKLLEEIEQQLDNDLVIIRE